MAAPILTWLLIVALLAVFLLGRSWVVARRRRARHAVHHHIVEMGTESDEFYIPGDENEDDRDTFNQADN